MPHSSRSLVGSLPPPPNNFVGLDALPSESDEQVVTAALGVPAVAVVKKTIRARMLRVLMHVVRAAAFIVALAIGLTTPVRKSITWAAAFTVLVLAQLWLV